MLHDQDLISIQEARSKVEKAYAAWLQYRNYSQEQIDAIVERMAAVGRAHSQELAEMAVEETGYGNAKDKLAKNLLCSDLLPRKIRDMKTVGLLREIPEQKVVEIGVPMGVVAAILPTTNPTSTVFYKTIISLKAGNAVVISPHPRAKRCTCYAASLMERAAVEAGAPEGLIQCIANSTMDATNALMRHERTAVILSTGGSGIVKAAYSSGKPAFGVGPGNVPVLLEKSADVAEAVRKVVDGKSFDYGTVCSSEQALITCMALKDQVLAELKKNKAYLCNEQQAQALGKLLVTPNWTVNPACVGQAPTKIAQMAGFQVPADTSILAAEIKGIGKQHPLSVEKLSPVLALMFVQDFEAAMDACHAILKFGGLGHTCVIHSKDDSRIREFGRRMPAFRVLVNTSAPQGSVGITTNVLPSMTLGCGAMAGNATSDNVGPLHLMNIKRLAYAVRRPEEALTVPELSNSAGRGSAIPGVDKQTIVAAVEKYLAERGIAIQPGAVAAAIARPSTPAPAASPAATYTPRPAAPTADVVSGVVNRFLASRRPVAPAHSARSAAAAASCACPVPDSKPVKQEAAPMPPPPPPKPAAPPKAVKPPEPEVTIVDFVCENDVRVAIQQSKKIFIGPKTIVTPAARELAAPQDVLVVAQRS